MGNFKNNFSWHIDEQEDINKYNVIKSIYILLRLLYIYQQNNVIYISLILNNNKHNLYNNILWMLKYKWEIWYLLYINKMSL